MTGQTQMLLCLSPLQLVARPPVPKVQMGCYWICRVLYKSYTVDILLLKLCPLYVYLCQTGVAWFLGLAVAHL
jgi:hypothetical protein